MENNIEQAEKFKEEGNNHFKVGKYADALSMYIKAVEIGADSPKTAIYLSNRAFCHIKMENYGLALRDAEEAIQKDPNQVKGYYRKGSAYLLLSKYEQAQECFRYANKLMGGKDPDIQEKLKTLRKIIFEREFSNAIEKAEQQITFDYSDILAPENYDGPCLEENDPVTPEWCEKLMDQLKDQKKLHKRYLWILLKRARDIFKSLPTLVEEEIATDNEIVVCGDTHGQFYDLLNIFKLSGTPTEQKCYLFNGDFVDRGSFSVEVIVSLLAWKVCNPKCIHLTRGNHEAKNMNKLYGFEGEVLHKYDNKTYDLFADIFCCLPLAYLLNKKVMVCHGGLFAKDGVKLADIKATNRFREPPDEGIMSDLLWADPSKENGRHPSKRGISIMFGPDVSEKFLKDNDIELLVRSHEMKEQGYDVEHSGRVITIFSAPNYCDQMGNKGAYIIFNGKEMKPKFVQFSAMEHPKVPPMAYSRSFYNMF